MVDDYNPIFCSINSMIFQGMVKSFDHVSAFISLDFSYNKDFKPALLFWIIRQPFYYHTHCTMSLQIWLNLKNKNIMIQYKDLYVYKMLCFDLSVINCVISSDKSTVTLRVPNCSNNIVVLGPEFELVSLRANNDLLQSSVIFLLEE